MAKIFISYSHKDYTFVSKLSADLGQRHAITIDSAVIIPDIPLIEQISAHIDVCNYFLPIISRHSVASAWVRREIALAYDKSLNRKSLLVPVVLGRTCPPAYLATIPYIRISSPAQLSSYRSGLTRLRGIVARSPLVSGNLVLPYFTAWGPIRVTNVGSYAASVSSKHSAAGASGLCLEHPLHIIGFWTLTLTVSGVKRGDFSGWSRTAPMMLKVEIDGLAVSPGDTRLISGDDNDYVKPVNGKIDYLLPRRCLNRGYIKKLEIVLGRGRFNRVKIVARLS